jgi:hypothetical protein
LPGAATAARAMEKFAVLGVDSVGIAHSQRAAATNRGTSKVGSGVVACWHLGSHHVAGLEASNGLGPQAVAARETVCRQLGPAVVRSCARLDCERRLLPADARPVLTNTGRVQRVGLGNSKPGAVKRGAAAAASLVLIGYFKSGGG